MIKKKKQSKFSYFHTGTMLKRGIRSLGSGEYSDETVNFSSFNKFYQWRFYKTDLKLKIRVFEHHPAEGL